MISEIIIAPSAVGSLQPHIKRGDFVICNDFIDRTKARKDTFFDGFTPPKGGAGVVHISSADCYCDNLGKDPSCPLEYQCKSYVQSRGLQLPKGNAEDIVPNSDVPVVGGGVLLYSGGWGHIA